MSNLIFIALSVNQAKAEMTPGVATALFWLGLCIPLFILLVVIMAGGLERKR